MTTAPANFKRFHTALKQSAYRSMLVRKIDIFRGWDAFIRRSHCSVCTKDFVFCNNSAQSLHDDSRDASTAVGHYFQVRDEACFWYRKIRVGDFGVHMENYERSCVSVRLEAYRCSWYFITHVCSRAPLVVHGKGADLMDCCQERSP